MTRLFKHALVATVSLLASATFADAHIVASRLGDFYAGALHPLSDLQDLILWAALGLLAGSLGASKGRWLVLVFPLGLLAGLILALAFGVGRSEGMGKKRVVSEVHTGTICKTIISNE